MKNKLEKILEYKNDIKNALIAKGAHVDDNISTYADEILNFKTSQLSSGIWYKIDHEQLLNDFGTEPTDIWAYVLSNAILFEFEDTLISIGFIAFVGENILESVSMIEHVYLFADNVYVEGLHVPGINVIDMLSELTHTDMSKYFIKEVPPSLQQ